MLETVKLKFEGDVSKHILNMCQMSEGLAKRAIQKKPIQTVEAVVPQNTPIKRAEQIQLGGLLSSEDDAIEWLTQEVNQECQHSSGTLIVFDLLLLRKSDLSDYDRKSRFFAVIEREVYFVLFPEECSYERIRSGRLSGVGDFWVLVITPQLAANADRSFDIDQASSTWSKIFISAFDGEGFLRCT